MSKVIRGSLAALCFSTAAAITAFDLDLIPDDLFRPWNEIPLPLMIDQESASEFITEFNNAVAISKDRNSQTPIVVPIHSNGGMMLQGQRIIETIENAGVPVILRCEDIAASMAAEILVTTKNVSRDATKDCRIFLHTPRFVYTDDEGNKITETLDDLYLNRQLYLQEFLLAPEGSARQEAITILYGENERDIRFLLLSTIRMSRDFAESTKLTPDDFITFFLEDDVTFYAREALLYGFIDTIEGEPLTRDIEDTLNGYCLSWANQLSICDKNKEIFSPLLVPEF